ncbi:hypothetical protein AB8O55_11490, partial [Saccharopolyspora cebuensis]
RAEAAAPRPRPDGGAATAAALAAAIRDRAPALVLCGDRSPDGGTGAVPAFLAALLGARQALGAVHVEADGAELLVRRRIDGGRRELLRLRAPAVVSVEGGLPLRRAGLAAVRAARRRDVPVVEPLVEPVQPEPARAVRWGEVRAHRPRARELPAPAGDAPLHRIRELTGGAAPAEPPVLSTPGSAAAAVEVLLSYLDRHGYLPEEHR